MKKRFSTPGTASVYVELGAGRLVATAAEVAEVVVEVTGPRAEEFKVDHGGNRIAVIAPHGRFFGRDAHQVSVTLPAGSELTTKTGSADTVTSGTLGLVALKTGSGDVAVDRADGPLVVQSGSGDITARECGGEVRIKSGSGDIDLGDVRGKTGISTGSGDVVLGTVRDRTSVKTGSGDLRVQRAEGEVTLTTASGDLTIASAAKGKVTARNVSGDVRIGIPVGTPVWTDINTVSGSLRNRLPSIGKPGEGQDFVELRASTVSGDVLLEQA